MSNAGHELLHSNVSSNYNRIYRLPRCLCKVEQSKTKALDLLHISSSHNHIYHETYPLAMQSKAKTKAFIQAAKQTQQACDPGPKSVSALSAARHLLPQPTPTTHSVT